MKKNLRAISMFAGCVSISFLLMVLSALITKQDLYLSLNNQLVTTINTLNLKGKQVSHNYTLLALILLTGSIPFSIMSLLIVSNRLPEIELEADEYNKERRLRKIRYKSELETEQELCDANRTVTVTAHEKRLESAFVDLAEASDWHYINNNDEEEPNMIEDSVKKNFS